MTLRRYSKRLPASFLARLLPVSLALAILSSAASASAQVVKLSMIFPEGSSWYTSMKDLGEKWKQASGGKVELRIYPGGVAGDDVDVVRKMRLGTLNAAILSPVGVGNIDRSPMCLEIPMMYSSVEEVDYVLEKMHPKLEAALAAKGFVVLDWLDAGWVRFFTKSPVSRPDELAKMKLFTWAGDNDAIEIWKASGFNVIPLPSTEISTSLQTGLVNAIPTTTQAALLFQWFNHARNMTDVKWARLTGALVVSKAVWDKIPADIRPALLAAAKETGKRLRDDLRAEEPRSLEVMKKKGLVVVPVDARAEAAWRATVDSALTRIRGTLVPGEMLDEAKKYVDEFRRQKGSGAKAGGE